MCKINTSHGMADHLYQFSEAQLTKWLGEIRAKLAKAKAHEVAFWERKEMAYSIALNSKKLAA